MPITDSQLETIKTKLAALIDDKADADAKTATSNAADTAAKQADALAAQAKLDESAADAKASADLVDLSAFIDSLVAPPPAA